MDRIDKFLINIVRKAICPETEISVPYGINWMDLLDVAMEQKAHAIAFDGIQGLPKDQLPETDYFAHWIGQTNRIETQYEIHKKVTVELATFYRSHGILMLLMKGYGLSYNYPIPNHRPTGDIDIYLLDITTKNSAFEQGNTLIEEENGMKVEQEYHKHSHYVYRGISVENHAKFIDDIYHKSNIAFESLLEKLIDEDVKNHRLSTIGDAIYLPSATWNALFLLRHAGEHFATEKITLRHILDLGTFFMKHSSEIDWDYVLKVYEHEDMKLFYDAIATICVRDLGIDSQCLHGYCHNEELADKILADIFAPNEELPMSSEGINRMGKFRYGIKKTARWWRNRWKYQMVYKESLWESFCTLALNRLSH